MFGPRLGLPKKPWKRGCKQVSESVYSKEQIRQAVREALLEALPVEHKKPQKALPPNSKLMKRLLESVQSDGKRSVSVDVRTQKSLNDFVQDLAQCLQDQHLAELVGAGRIKFSFAQGTGVGRSSGQATARRSSQPEVTNDRKAQNGQTFNGRMQSGVLTEAKVLAISKTDQRIEIGKNVILTPLAKDRARRLKIEIVRQ